MGKFDDMSNEELLEYLEGVKLTELEIELITRLKHLMWCRCDDNDLTHDVREI